MIKIFINEQELELSSKTKIRINKVFEDLQNPDKRRSAHSYTIQVPRTKFNESIFSHYSHNNVDNKFDVPNYRSKIISGNIAVLTGYAKIKQITRDEYHILIYEELTGFFEYIKNNNLRDLTFDKVKFEGESGIASHNNSRLNSDQTFYQFPFIYYNNFRVDDYIDKPNKDSQGNWNERCLDDLIQSGIFNSTSVDYTHNHYNYIINTTICNSDPADEYEREGLRSRNTLYYQYFPPALYVWHVLIQIFKESGWTLQTSLVDGISNFSKQFKKLIIPYTGDTNVFETDDIGAWGSDAGIETVGSTDYYKMERFLPDMKQSVFIKQLLLMFNLYLTSDPETKTIFIETYDDFFLDNDLALNLDNKKKDEKFTITPLNEVDKNINLKYIDDDSDGAKDDQFFKKALDFINIETNENGTDVEFEFAATHFREVGIFNNEEIDGTLGDHNEYGTVAIPYISASNLSDDQGLLWWNNDACEEEDGCDTVPWSYEDMNYGLEPRILKYEGVIKSDEIPELQLLWVWLGDSKFIMNQCSFFSISDGKYPQEIQYNELINDYIEEGSKINLCFNDYPEYNLDAGEELPDDTRGLYKIFYSNKYNELASASNMTLNTYLTEDDYINIIANKPVLLDDVFYNVTSVKNYDVNTGQSTMNLKRRSISRQLDSHILFSEEIVIPQQTARLTVAYDQTSDGTYSARYNYNVELNYPALDDFTVVVSIECVIDSLCKGTTCSSEDINFDFTLGEDKIEKTFSCTRDQSDRTPHIDCDGVEFQVIFNLESSTDGSYVRVGTTTYEVTIEPYN